MRPVSFILLALLAAPGVARAQHPLQGRLSPAGLDFLERALPQEIPSPLALPETTVEIGSSCAEGPTTLTQLDTSVDLTLRTFDLSVPSPGLLQADVVADVHATGQMIPANVPGFCGYAPVCDDTLDVLGAGATLGFTILWDEATGLVVDVADVQLDVDKNAVDIVFSGCLQADSLNDLADTAKDLLLDALVQAVQDIASTQIAPQIQGLLSSFSGEFAFDAGLAAIDAKLTGVGVDPTGITVDGEADVTTSLSPPECLGPDPGEPVAHPGELPDFAALAPDAHVDLAVNLGLVDDAFHALWRTGLVCMNGEQLAAYGVEIDLSELVDVLPGWPPGTTLDPEVVLAQPPTVAGRAGDDALLELTIPGLEISLYGHLPDGTTRSVFLDVDARATLSARYDRDRGALVLDPEDVKIDNLEIYGAPEVAGRLDAAHLARAAETKLAPAILEQLGAFALALPLPGFGGYYVIPRAVGTTDAYVWGAVDLYRGPDEDTTPPETAAVAVPPSPTRVEDARIRMTGTDDQVPTDLLRFQATIDEVASEPSYLKDIPFGEKGVTRSYHLAVAAVDLAGNVDPTPYETDVVVDGIPPHLHVDGEGVLRVASPVAELSWAASDDLTEAADLAYSVTIDRLADPADPYSAERIGVMDLEPGVTTARVQLAPDGHYVLGVTTRDEAGNATIRNVLVVTEAASGCGCSAAAGTGASPILLLLLALPFLRRRARKESLLVALFVLLLPSAASAGGFYVPGTGPVGQARAGAFAARADDPSALAYNPAGLAGLHGTRLLLGFNLVELDLAYQREGRYEATQTGHAYEGELFPEVRDVSNPSLGLLGFQAVPLVALSTDLGLDLPLTFGVGVYAPQGYPSRAFPETWSTGGDAGDPAPGPQRYDVIKQDVIVALPSVAVGWRPVSWAAVGARLSWGVVNLRHRSALWAFENFQEDPGLDGVFDADVSDGFVPGAGVGVLLDPFSFLTLALSWDSPMAVDAKGSGAATLGPGVGFAGVQDDIEPVNDPAQARCGVGGTVDALKTCVRFDLPQMATAGLRWHLGPREAARADLEADVRWENWSAASRFEVLADGRSALSGIALEPVPLDHGMKDVWSFRLGGSYQVVIPDAGLVEVRAGIAHDTAAAPDSWSRVDIDGAARTTITGGIAWENHLVRVSLGGGTSVSPDRQVPICAWPSGPDAQSLGCDGAGEPPVAERTQPDPAQPLETPADQRQSPFNAGTYRSHYVLLNLGVEVHF